MEKGAKLTLKAQSLAADVKRTQHLLDYFYAGLVDLEGLTNGFREIIQNAEFKNEPAKKSTFQKISNFNNQIEILQAERDAIIEKALKVFGVNYDSFNIEYGKWERGERAKAAPIKYKVKEARPRWRDLRENKEIKSAANYYNHMEKEHGFGWKQLVGAIGQGVRTHIFNVLCKVEGDTIHVASCHSFCGSAQWSSALALYPDQELKCDCKRCNKFFKNNESEIKCD